MVSKFIKNNKVSIGMPIYNVEKFIRKSIESILSQTYSNFELIISDNASTDKTSEICEEYKKKDPRIRYFHHPKNRGPTWNFNFVLKEAKSKYFMWAAADDIRHPEFIEKNIQVLQTHENVICSMSKAEFYELEDESLTKIDLAFKNFVRKLRTSMKPPGIYPLTGTYDQKIRVCLKKLRMWMVFGLFRTDIIQKSGTFENFMGGDLPPILRASRYGDFFVVNENLMKVYNGGISKIAILKHISIVNTNKLEFLFPYYPLTTWCWKYLGSKLFLKNLDYFIELTLWGFFRIILDIVRLSLHKIFKQ